MSKSLAVGSINYEMLKEFEIRGFVSSGARSQFLSILRSSNYREHYRIFKTTHRGKKRKEMSRFGPLEIFGRQLYYYYDIRRKEEFVEFLVRLFYDKNPVPDSNVRSVFTRLLKYHGLTWETPEN